MEQMQRSSVLALVLLASLLTGCASTGTTRGGSLAKAFVPPPPFGGSSSTITVVPAKTAKRTSSEKSWGVGETPGGGQASVPRQRSGASELASPGHLRSLYELKTVDREAHQPAPQTARPATKTSSPSAGGNPVPVLYEQGQPESPSARDQIDAPPAESTQDDPRRFT